MKIVVNWTTKTPGDSKVRFGPSQEYGQEVHAPGKRTLHHVEIPLAKKDSEVHYSVSSGEQVSPDATFRTYPTDVLRVAVVANWQGKPKFQSLINDKVHLLLTAGDNIPDLWGKCGVGTKDCTKPYEALIDAYPESEPPHRAQAEGRRSLTATGRRKWSGGSGDDASDASFGGLSHAEPLREVRLVSNFTNAGAL